MRHHELKRRDLLGLAGASLFSSALPQPATAQASPKSRPNLILFFPDEMRADGLACYGNPVTRTPNFDKLAGEGARFENCHVQYPVCGASRCSLLTGWPTSVRGHRSLYYFLRPEEPNMFRYLRQAGYDVLWFGKNDALAAQTFADSVTEWHDAPSADAGYLNAASSVSTFPLTMLLPGGGDRRKTSDYALLQMAIKVLERREQERPFCIFLPLSQPHPPYAAPADFNTMYKPGDLPPLPPPGLAKKPAFHQAIRDAYGLVQVGDAEFRKVRAMYLGQISYSDWLLGELLEALERTNHAKDTAIVVSSDHGDYAGDYGLVEKWPSGLESCLTHVPLIARIPGLLGAPASREMVELYDIMPTFLELAGARATHTHFARSLLPQIGGRPGDPDRAAFSEGGYNIYEPQAFEPRLGGIYAPKTNLQNDKPETIRRCASIKTGRHTFVSRPGGQSELYDRQNDPQERTNLWDSKDKETAAVRDRLQQRLLTWYIDTSGVPDANKDSRNLPSFYPPPSPTTAPGERERLLDQ